MSHKKTLRSQSVLRILDSRMVQIDPQAKINAVRCRRVLHFFLINSVAGRLIDNACVAANQNTIVQVDLCISHIKYSELDSLDMFFVLLDP